MGAGAMWEMGAGLERLHQEEGWDAFPGVLGQESCADEGHVPSDGEASPASVLGDAGGECEEDVPENLVAGREGSDGDAVEGCAGAGRPSGKGKQQETEGALRSGGPGGPRMTRRAYRTLVRLETAAHRAKHKGLCEMCFTVLAAHECFASHDTWKLDVKPAMWKIRRAMQQRDWGRNPLA